MALLDVARNALPLVGVDPAVLNDADVAHAVVLGHNVVSVHGVPGVEVALRRNGQLLEGSVTVAPGVEVARPIHLCFGLEGPRDVQEVRVDFQLGQGARARVTSCCAFPGARDARHLMHATLVLGTDAVLTYNEHHHHGMHGAMIVAPHASVRVGTGARFFSNFALLAGAAGKLEIDYDVAVGDDGLAELSARVVARQADEVTLKEAVRLVGVRSRGLIRSRVVVQDDAHAEVVGITEAAGRLARGHVDCREIVLGRARAGATPVVRVLHPEAKVTHEAAIGSVDRKELETLMARGLSPEQAIELVVSGILR
ncbi:MAG: SufD family Fe-S cluster assembly protein [Deltaproteobacteria bacterium]|nr:SufD family Fe-S cluster assembly protein [Deltaproteobacteria bacterium]